MIRTRGFEGNEINYFKELINTEIDLIKYLRAIQEEFGIDIWSLIPEIE